MTELSVDWLLCYKHAQVLPSFDLLCICNKFVINIMLFIGHVTQAQTFAISELHFIYTKNLPTKNGWIISGHIIKGKSILHITKNIQLNVEHRSLF